MRTAITAAFASAALALAACGTEAERPSAPPAPAPGEGPVLGYNDNFAPGEPGAELLVDSGAEFGRTPLDWAAVEASPGARDFAAADARAEELEQRGLRPFWSVINAPCWAAAAARCPSPDGGDAPAEHSFEAYAELVVDVAERYPDSFAIEIWNEPNVPKFWSPRPDPSAYRALVDVTVGAAEESGVDVPLLLAGPSPIVLTGARAGKIEATRFLSQTLGDEPPAVHAVGLHPYGLGPGDQGARALRRFEEAVGVIERRAPGMPIWVTEIGFSTAGRHAVGPPKQAARLVELFEALAARGVPVITVHRFFDQADPPFPFEAGFGVVSATGEPKPAYCALAAAAGNDAPACANAAPARDGR